MHFRLTTLDNGLRVISEEMPEIRSVAIGCWVDTGTRDELPTEAGASHYLEHLLFKGTERFSAQAIAEAFDAVGAQSNAFTTKEFTCFWARLLDDDLSMGMEILGDMLQQPAFRQHEIESERQVVIEEINMTEDDPSDIAHESFFQALWRGHPLERPVLGTRESITAMSRDDILGYWDRRYHPHGVVVAVAGHVEHDQVVSEANRRLGEWNGRTVDHEYATPIIEPRVTVRTRNTEQAHLVLGGEGLRRDDKRRYALVVLNHILGGGMSSRLFRVIREERGLAYAVYSYRAPFADSGAFAVYAGTTPAQAGTVLELVREQLDAVTASGVTAEELERAKGHMKGSLALSMEDASSRMHRLGRAELIGNEHLSIDETVGRVEAVTRDDVLEVAEVLFSGPRVLGAVGPFSEPDLAAYVT